METQWDSSHHWSAAVDGSGVDIGSNAVSPFY